MLRTARFNSTATREVSAGVHIDFAVRATPFGFEMIKMITNVANVAVDSMRYEAFISYRHVEPDRRWAQWLHSSLERYRIPSRIATDGSRKRLGRVFRDEEELSASADLSREIEEALGQSRWLIVICSPRTPASQWVNKEVVRFRELGRGDRILALLIEGEPAEAFPRALCEIRRALANSATPSGEEVETIEPLAADVRPTAGESSRYLRRMARLRLLACILGCRFDDLRRRDQERRTRTLAYVGLLLAALSTSMLGLTVFAISQRNRAEDNAALAENRRNEAEQQRDRAEQQSKLAERRLTDARQTANQIMFEVVDGKLKALRGVSQVRQQLAQLTGKLLDGLLEGTTDDETVRARFAAHMQRGDLAKSFKDDISAHAEYTQAVRLARDLAGRAPSDVAPEHYVTWSLGHLARQEMHQGRPDRARQLADEALEIARRLVEANTASVMYQRDLAINLSLMAELERRVSHLDAAILLQKESLDINRHLAALDPKNNFHAAFAAHELGQLEASQGRANVARELFVEAAQIQRQLTRESPEALDLQRGASSIAGSLADLETREGNIDSARKLYEEQLGIDRRLAAGDPADLQCQRDLARSLSRIGNFERTAGRNREARKYLFDALAAARSLVANEPENLDSQAFLSVCVDNLGGLSRSEGKLDEAQRQYGEALELRRKLTTKKPENREFQELILLSLHQMGYLADKQGRPDERRAFAEEKLRIARPLASADPANTTLSQHIVFSLADLAWLEEEAGRRDRAREYLQQALEAVQRVIAAAPENFAFPLNQSHLYAKLIHLFMVDRQFDAALKVGREYLDWARPIATALPNDLRAQDNLASCYMMLGLTAGEAGRVAESVDWLTQSIAVLMPLAETGKVPAQRVADLRQMLASVQARKNSAAEALVEPSLSPSAAKP